MHLGYFDESGDPSSWQEQKHFVIAGVAVHEGKIHALTEKLTEVQRQYFPEITVPVAFHATEIRRGKGRFKNLPLEVRENILVSVYSVIRHSSFPDLIVFAAALNIDSAQNSTQARRDTFEEVCSRFNNFLIWQFRLKFPTKGLVILDRNREEHYRELLSTFQQTTKYGYLGNVVDIPYFARCQDTRMLQLADFCANAVFRYYDKQDDKGMNMILPRIYRNPLTRKLDGLTHITKNTACKCLVCGS